MSQRKSTVLTEGKNEKWHQSKALQVLLHVTNPFLFSLLQQNPSFQHNCCFCVNELLTEKGKTERNTMHGRASQDIPAGADDGCSCGVARPTLHVI